MSRMRLATLAALALATGLALTACTDQATPEPTTTTSSEAPAPVITSDSPAPVDTPTETPTPTATPTPTPTPTPTLAGPPCGTLVTDQELYDYDSNYSELSKPPAGITCAWTSGSTSSVISLVLAPKNTTSYPGSKVPGYTGTFAVVSGKGTVHATIGSYAVTLASPTFTSVDDALPFLDLFGHDLK